MRTKLKENEIVIFETEKHWFANLWVYIFVGIWPAIGIGIFLFMLGVKIAGYNFGGHDAIELTYTALGFIAFGGLLSPFLFYKRKLSRTNKLIATNMRLIYEIGVYSHTTLEFTYDKIDNILYNDTPFGRKRNYGTIEVQTTSDTNSAYLSFVKSPKEVKEAIQKAKDEFIKNPPSESVPEKAIKEDNEPDTKACPFCAETIKKKAKFCRYCKNNLE